MAQPDKQRGALQIIFSFFLGLMVTAFIGVGVYTFYPPPEQRFEDQLQQLYRQQEDIQSFKEPSALTAGGSVQAARHPGRRSARSRTRSRPLVRCGAATRASS